MSTLSDNRVQFEAALAALLAGFESGTGTGGTILPSRLTIINYVKAKLDELIPEGEGVQFNLSAAPNVTNPLDLLINAHLDESTKDIILTAPIRVLYPAAESATGLPMADDKTGYIILPASFLRLSSLKMADWTTSINHLESKTLSDGRENPVYAKQKYSFLRGGINKPKAFLDWKTSEGAMKRIIEYYSIDTSHGVEKLFYIPEQTAENFIVVNPNLLDSLAWMCAGKIMQITGQGDAFKLAMEQVKQSYINL